MRHSVWYSNCLGAEAVLVNIFYLTNLLSVSIIA